MAPNGIRSRPLPSVSWRVVNNRLCVPLSSTEDLLSDTTAILEDIRAAIAESSKLIADANRLLAESRGVTAKCWPASAGLHARPA
jgi:hypothetical protein